VETKRRFKRLYVYWGIALALLATAGLFSWLLVIPLWRVREVAGDYTYRKYDAKDAIAKLGGPEKAYPMLRLFLKLPASIAEGDRQERTGAVRLLIVNNRPPAECLIELLDDENREVAGWAVKALHKRAVWAARYEGESTDAREYRQSLVERVPRLIETLEYKNDLVRFKVCLTLAELGTDARSALPRIRELLRTSDGRTLKAALFAMYRISPDRTEVATILAKALGNGNRDVQLEALRLLQKMRASAKAATPALVAALKDPDAYVRAAAAFTLVLVGEIGALKKARSDEDPIVAQAATDALKKIEAAQERRQ
jgi:HEAT repeat protein